jgi:hypothetical protein
VSSIIQMHFDGFQRNGPESGSSNRTSRRDFLLHSASLAACLSFPSRVFGNEQGATAAAVAVFSKRLGEYQVALNSFLARSPLASTDWEARKLWDGGDEGLLTGALDYDLVGSTLRLYAITKDEAHLKLATDVADFLKVTYIDPVKGRLPAYRIYAAEGYHNLSQLLRAEAPAKASGFAATLRLLSTGPAYAELNDRTERAILHPSMNREVALLLLAKAYALKAQGGGLTSSVEPSAAVALTPYLNAMKSHLTLFTKSLLSNDKVKPLWGPEMRRLAEDPENYLIGDEFVRPFMVAISARSAARVAEAIGEGSTVSLAADTLLALKRIYVTGRGLPYTDRLLPPESKARQLSSDTPDDSIVPSLNLLVANACETVASALRREVAARNTIKGDTLMQLATSLRADSRFSDGTLKEAKQALY